MNMNHHNIIEYVKTISYEKKCDIVIFYEL